jgi:hypothetical protein
LSKRLIAMLAGAMAIAIVAAGCGSSSDTTVVLTKTEFIKQGDAICAKGGKQIEDEADEFAKENNVDTSKEDQEEVIATVVAPVLQTQVDEISELGAPSGEEDTTAAIVEALADGAEELEENPASLLESDGAGPLDKAKELAGRFGFKVCGQG